MGWVEKVGGEVGEGHAARWLLPTGSYSLMQYIDETVNMTHGSRPVSRSDLVLLDKPSASYSFQRLMFLPGSLCYKAS